ncbi:MAG TPA: alpha/beta hydrolase [Caulobacteraceae bacterium]|nr:alpha/beta hydrolase [Caulobacteraceae bacterium]
MAAAAATGLAPVGATAAARRSPAKRPTAPPQAPPQLRPPPPPEVVDLPDGTRLHYVTDGLGEAVIFVHGSLSDYTYWNDQIEPFADRYRPFAYSRRYNWPNDNRPIKGYSAITDSNDLAAMIVRLNLAPAHIVGHSFGALTALILAIQHPELIHTLTLAEAPAVSLLKQLPPDQAKDGKAMYDDIMAHMVAPMRAAFAKGKDEAGVATFIDYVRGDPGAWDKFTDQQKADTLKDAREWEVMLPTGTLFPEMRAADVAAIKLPTLMLSGAKSYPFLGVIDAELERLIPGVKRVTFPDATHQMWLEHPDLCRAAVTQLIDAHR